MLVACRCSVLTRAALAGVVSVQVGNAIFKPRFRVRVVRVDAAWVAAQKAAAAEAEAEAAESPEGLSTEDASAIAREEGLELLTSTVNKCALAAIRTQTPAQPPKSPTKITS